MREAYGLIRLMFRPTKPSQAAQDRRTYIPPDIASAMADHMQRTMPAHLKQYQGGGTYVPQRAENEMTKHLEASLPAHMKQYAGAYMQQQVVGPGLAKPTFAAGPSPSPNPKAAVAPAVHVFQPNPPISGPQENYMPSAAPVQAQTVPNPDQAYSFITNPEPPPKISILSKLPGGNSMMARIGLIAGGLLVLLIIFTIFRSVLGGGSNYTGFITIAQDQQELIHLATNASQQQDLSTSNKNLAATMQLSLASSQGNLINYLIGNHQKIKTKQLNLKVSKATDDQLTAAAAATTYNQTFQEIIQTKLTAYSKDLQQTYKQSKGKRGHALLSDNYRQARLFQVQLTQTTN